MSIKDKLKVYPWDKLSHYQWASWFAALVATIAVCVAVYGMRLAPWIALLGSGVLCIISGYVAGLAGEQFDKQANAAAAARGEPLPHTVSEGDVVASAIGGAVVALPLIVSAIALRMTSSG